MLLFQRGACDSSPISGTSDSSRVYVPDWVQDAVDHHQGIVRGDVVQMLPDGGYGSFQCVVNVPGESSPFCIVKLTKVR